MKKYLSKSWFTLFLLIGLIKPSGLADLGNYVGGVWKILDLLLSFIQYCDLLVAFIIIVSFCRVLKKKDLGIIISIVLFQLLFVISDVLNGVKPFSSLRYLVMASTFVFIVEVYYYSGNLKKLIKILSIMLSALIVLNFLTILSFPNGLYVDVRGWQYNYLLGYKNRNIYYYLPTFFAVALNEIETKKKIGNKTMVIAIIMSISGIISQSDTTAFIMVLITLMTVFLGTKKIPECINFFTVLIASGTISFIIIFFPKLQIISDFTEKLFSKTATFHARRSIWDSAILSFLERPLYGNGSILLNSYLNWDWNVTQAHNKYLDILYIGGIITLGTFVIIFVNLEKKRRKQPTSYQGNIAIFVITGYAILFIMESAKADVMFFAIIMLIFHIDGMTLIQKNKKLIALKQIKIKIIK